MQVEQVRERINLYYRNNRRIYVEEKEVPLCKELSKILGGRTEVITPVGRIDLLNEFIIIETKISKYWKQAIGQLYCYELYHKRPNRAIGIIGKMPRYCPSVCESLNLWLFHYDFNNSQWNLLFPYKNRS